MTTLPRTFAQQQSRSSSMITFGNTVWMYPPADVEYGLAYTTYSYRRVGNTLIFPDMNNLSGVYTDIFKHETLEDTIEYGVKELTRQLSHTLTIKNIKWNNTIVKLETLLQNIVITDHAHSDSLENKNHINSLPFLPNIASA